MRTATRYSETREKGGDAGSDAVHWNAHAHDGEGVNTLYLGGRLTDCASHHIDQNIVRFGSSERESIEDGVVRADRHAPEDGARGASALASSRGVPPQPKRTKPSASHRAAALRTRACSSSALSCWVHATEGECVHTALSSRAITLHRHPFASLCERALTWGPGRLR